MTGGMNLFSQLHEMRSSIGQREMMGNDDNVRSQGFHQ